MGRLTKIVTHTPVWVAAPLRVNRAGDTKPGFLCIHELENGNGWCGSNVFDLEDAAGDHACCVELRGWPNISRPCYDKPRRCPGWAGGGWKGAKHLYCRERDGYSGYVNIDFNSRWWKWKTHKCTGCGVIVLPTMIRWTDWRSWWYEVRYARNSWMWLIRLETWWGKKRGWW